MFKIKRLLIVPLVAMLIIPLAIHAQETDAPVPTDVPVEVTPEPPPTPALPSEVQTPEDILGIVVAALIGGAATFAGSAFVTVVVSLLKLFIPASVASGDTLKNIVSVVTWLAYSIAVKFGLGTEFQNVAAFLVPILTTAIPLIGVLIGSRALFLGLKAAKVPILGSSRT